MEPPRNFDNTMQEDTMKRTFLAFALSVLLIAALAACSSRPSDNGNGSTNNGTSNSGTSNNGSSTSPRPNTNSSGSNFNDNAAGSGSVVDGVLPGDGVMDDTILDDGTPDDVIVDGEVVGDDRLDVDPVYHGARTYSVTHHTWEYCADCNGNVIDFGDEAVVGDNARRMVNSVTNGVRRVGDMVGDMAYDMTHM